MQKKGLFELCFSFVGEGFVGTKMGWKGEVYFLVNVSKSVTDAQEDYHSGGTGSYCDSLNDSNVI